MTPWRPPIALTFTRDTAYPIHTERRHVGGFTQLPDALHFVSWIIVHKCRLHIYYYNKENVYFIGDYTSLGDREAIDWLSQKIGRSFIDYAADLFVELCEKNKAICDTDPKPERQVMFFPDKGDRGLYLYGIDFENQIIKIAHARTKPLNITSYPAEEALKMLGIDWDVVRRTFGVAYLTAYKKQELINALNKLIKDEVIIRVWIDVVQRTGVSTYRSAITAASPNNIAFWMKLIIKFPLKDLLSPCQIASHKGGITISNLDTLPYKVLYIPAEQRVIFHYPSAASPRESKIPVELKAAWGNLQIIWDHNSWILLTSRDTSNNSFEYMKLSAATLSNKDKDIDILIDTLEIRLRESKRV